MGELQTLCDHIFEEKEWEKVRLGLVVEVENCQFLTFLNTYQTMWLHT